MGNTLERVNQTIWELQRKVEENPDDLSFRKELLKFFHESRLFSERKSGVPEEDRSFLLLQERESICCFLIHGAGGSPKEMQALGAHLYRLGYTVYAMRLTLDSVSDNSALKNSIKVKFRRNKDDKKRRRVVTGNSWSVCLSEAEIIINTLFSYTRGIYIVGFSFGGTIALNLLHDYPVKGAVLVAPALFPVRTGRYMIFQFLRSVLPSAARSLAPREDTIMELMEKTRKDMESMRQPVLVIQSSNDPVISTKGYHTLKRHLKNPKSRSVLLDSDRHVLVGGEEAEEVFRLCGDFIKEI